jgi:hypothetical protein
LTGRRHARGQAVGELSFVSARIVVWFVRFSTIPTVGIRFVDVHSTVDEDAVAGTSTSSKMTKASCSSKRRDSGRSKGCAPGGRAVRHRKISRRDRPDMRRPGVRRWPRQDGQTRVDGDLVGEGRERREDARPRTTMPSAVRRPCASVTWFPDPRIRHLVDRGLDDRVA